MDPWRVPRPPPPTHPHLPSLSALGSLATTPICEEVDEAGRKLDLAADAFLREIETRVADPTSWMVAVGLEPPTSAMAVRELRTTKHAELKNTYMMATLLHLEWFVEYRAELEHYRHHGGPKPVYPAARVEEVETKVDALIREVIDPAYAR